MSVLIKGMEMPKKGLLEIIISPDGICYALERPLIDTEHAKVTKYYDTIELPDHGDLIDRDELMMKMWGADAYASNQRSCNVRAVFVRDIEAAPVVIPAERAKNDSY